MKFGFQPAQLDNWECFCFYEAAFSKKECESIIAMGTDLTDARVGDNKGGELNKTIRESQVQFINPVSGDMSLFRKLKYIAEDANTNRYGFQLSGFYEGLQLTRYDGEKKAHYDYHMDNGPGQFSRRKLSIVTLLSDEKSYEGGNLEFFGAGAHKIVRKQGTVIVFPSYMVHRVSEVTKGTRFSLVGWISGEPYR